MDDIYKGLHGCREFIDELLDWLKVERSQKEFDEKFGDNSIRIEKLYPVKDDDYILGGQQGLGAGCWAGKLHALQILISRDAVDAETRNGLVFYKRSGKE